MYEHYYIKIHTDIVVEDILSSIRFPLSNGSKGSCFAVILVLSNAVKGSVAKPSYDFF
jgi:hypothetical protein